MPAGGDWSWSDAWVLCATLMSNGTIGSVLATADYIDHAVPSLDELRAAFDRMAAAKLVEVRWSEVMQERRARLG